VTAPGCTVAAIIQLLGYMPPEGTVITVPESQAAKYTKAERAKAVACLASYKVRLDIARDR
jgi:hypothetical protein